jgi:hypothetical protein
MALSLFGGGKPDHPLADIKHVRKLVSGLPANDSVKALNDVTTWLDSINGAEGFRLERRYEVIDVLDQAATNHARKIGDVYQASQRLQKFEENKMWTAASEFWKLLGDAYGRCIEQLWSDASAAATVKKQLPAIVARALRALTMQMKWTLLSYSPVDVRVWGEVGRHYFFAENKEIATAPVEIYPGEHGTVQQEFLKAMMLGVSANHGLNPVQQEIAARTAAHFARMFALQLQPGPGCSFCFDLSLREPPAHVTPEGFKPGTTARCFGAGGALAALNALIPEIRKHDRVPAELNLGAKFESDLVLSALQHLALHWSDAPPARRSERRRIAMRITVVHGFQALLRAIESLADDTSLDFEHAAATESWAIENVSGGGFGAIIPPVMGDWIKVGTLLGLQADATQSWGAGIIRRIVRDESRQRRVGIQQLAKAVIPVKLAPAGSVSQAGAARTDESALLLSTTPDKHGEISLLVRSGSGARDHALEMNVRGKRYHLMPRTLIESGDDYDWATFRVTQQVG